MTGDQQNEIDNQSKPQGVRRFLRFSLIYALGDALAKGARIVLIPYYLSVLEQSQIGELAIVQAIIFLSWTLLAFGLGFAVRRYYYDYEKAGQSDAFVSSLWVSRWLGGLPVYGCLMLVGWWFYHWSEGTISLQLILLAITAGFLKGGLNVVEFWLNIREEPVKYRAFTFSQFLLTTLLIIYFVTFQSLGVLGIVLGEIVSYSLFVLVSAFMLFSKSKPMLTVVRWKEVTAYCAPVLPHALFMWGLMGVDRLVLTEYVGKAEIGVYEIGYLLGSFLSIVVRSMRAAWIPAYFRGAERTDSKAEFAKTASIYFVCTFATALLGLLYAPEIIWLFSLWSPSSYSESATIMQIVLFGFVAMAVFLAINQPLLYEQRTGLLASISGFGLAVNLVANWTLVPRFGIYGAAYATVIAYVAISLLTLTIMRRFYDFKWNGVQNVVLSTIFVLFGSTVFLLPNVPLLWIQPIKIVIFIMFLLATFFRIGRKPDNRIKIEARFTVRDVGRRPRVSQ